MKISAVILTLNESIHLARCIESLLPLTSSIIVVDSGSIDDTTAIAERFGAQVLTNKWRNYATQFNWALDQIGQDTDWILRIDADEVLGRDLAQNLRTLLPTLGADVSGILVNRRMAFMGQPIRFGGLFPTRMVRVFRRGHGQCENRWMDEHIKVTGKCIPVDGELLDDNRNSLTWWVGKHNSYSSREAVDLLNAEYKFMAQDSMSVLEAQREVSFKRWLKETIYVRLPTGARAWMYFLYRYVLRFGFLDGQEGAAFHFLQGYWYRYLVDCKVLEVKNFMRANRCDVVTAIRKVLGIDPI
jgi:glycosyltransferase involved in cell wall biosynthesis